METIFGFVAGLAVLIGTFFSVTGVLGYYRLPDVYTRLHATGKVGGLANGVIIHLEVAADGADDDLARVQADSNLNRNPLAPPQVCSIRALPSADYGPHRPAHLLSRRPVHEALLKAHTEAPAPGRSRTAAA